MNTILIRVVRFGSDGKEIVLFRQTLDIPDSLDFPFARIEKDLRLLFPLSQMVIFQVS